MYQQYNTKVLKGTIVGTALKFSLERHNFICALATKSHLKRVTVAQNIETRLQRIDAEHRAALLVLFL